MQYQRITTEIQIIYHDDIPDITTHIIFDT